MAELSCRVAWAKCFVFYATLETVESYVHTMIRMNNMVHTNIHCVINYFFQLNHALFSMLSEVAQRCDVNIHDLSKQMLAEIILESGRKAASCDSPFMW